jgi:hypothetical protein
MGAVQALASHADVRICFEAIPGHDERKPPSIEVDVRDRKVSDILGAIVDQDPRYEFRERLGVIEVLPVGAAADARDCLNTVIPELLVDEPWKYAFPAVQCQLDIVTHHPCRIVPDPIRANLCSGSSHLSHPPPGRLTGHFEHETVRDILDQLSTMAGNVAWYVTFTGSSPTCENIEFGEYQPKAWYPGDHGWVNELPSRCLQCHYHRPEPKR